MLCPQGKKALLTFFSKFNAIHPTSNQSRDSSVDIINSKRQVKGKFSHVVQIDVRRLLYCYTLNPFFNYLQNAVRRPKEGGFVNARYVYTNLFGLLRDFHQLNLIVSGNVICMASLVFIHCRVP